MCKFFIGNIKIYLQFISFFQTDMTQEVEIIPRVRPGRVSEEWQSNGSIPSDNKAWPISNYPWDVLWFLEELRVQIAREGKYQDVAVTSFNPLRAKFFRGYIKHILHFISFLHIDVTQVVEILPQIRQGPTHSTLSISWLLVSWRRKEPGHQQLWYWHS